MHPYITEGLGRERLQQLYQEADHHRLVREVVASEPRSRVRVALGERMVRLGMRLMGPERGRPATARFYGE